MSDLFPGRLALLAEPSNLALLGQCLHGIERECLRVDQQGELALTPHPKALGSALTHPRITTDYSESLLEFITPTAVDPQATLDELDAVHRFTYSRLGNEYLWSHSMPCPLPEEERIPIAEYGSSNIGQLKHVYRRGLAVRYGRTMQCIAGIHYNFSLPERLWSVLQAAEGDTRSLQDYQSARYISLIRNFRRYSWLLMYLFGASPALDTGFLRGREHQLEQLDADTLYLPWATSLRMSDLGYQNNAQSGLTPCYDALHSYTESLRQAVSTPYPPYAALGTHDADGRWQQLNTNVLQIENEYYSNIRPKRVTYSGERPIQALMARGVQYVEVRCLDINPFLPLGIDIDEARFLDAFLLYCALQESPCLVEGECGASAANFLSVVKEGRKPGLQLQRRGQSVGLQDWARELLEAIGQAAGPFDASLGGDAYVRALQVQQAKVEDPSLTPSAQVLACLRDGGESFRAFSLRQSRLHAEHFRAEPLPEDMTRAFDEDARRSLEEQAALERDESGDFDSFVAAYQASLVGISV
ncbi:glutamate--cysteine ligase [Pseudomonas sp. ABC1]|uniref:glutamate--cysteine ligase n=1 Tax=Pseudomonas sp. ABC1 TaxID=2748080 RepID=UPI0015C3C2D2|nr:glutamate--cysteine ligase [Pseudomonas sp. ABC1]QLF93809.1 glutamate--cysteine ligase [Pseudomonas sp. ABC1]